ncbi:MAG: hypothetical protein ABFC98_05770 [Candidatus Cloacimonas sp.]
MISIGIDPGQTGAIGIIRSDGSYDVYDMPIYEIKKEVRSKRSITPKKTTQVKKFIDRKKLLELLKILVNYDKPSPYKCLCYIERQGVRPDQSANSGFNTGKQYGEILMALDALGVSFEEISAQEWQKHFSIGKDTKGDSCRKAENLFPKLVLRGPRGRTYDGRSDAILITLYGKRKNGGE